MFLKWKPFVNLFYITTSTRMCSHRKCSSDQVICKWYVQQQINLGTETKINFSCNFRFVGGDNRDDGQEVNDDCK